MNIRIQISAEWFERYKTNQQLNYLPSFQYFKETYNDERYSLAQPSYKESMDIYDGKTISRKHVHGMGCCNGIGYRYYNSWMGCIFFTGNNLHGDYIVEAGQINQVLKHL